MPRKDPTESVPQLRSIPIHDNGEPLVDLLSVCRELHWEPHHPAFEYQRYTLARQGLAERLCQAAAMLPAGIRLGVVECYRAPAIQKAMHQATRERMRREHPEWTPQRLGREANRFSAPMDLQVPPPHSTGGAVDLHLVGEDGQLLDLTSPYEIMDPRGARAMAKGLTPTAMANRALLRDVLLAAGLTNYPSEWWHWSYGDQGWAYRGDHPHALYGAIEPASLHTDDHTFRVREAPLLHR